MLPEDRYDTLFLFYAGQFDRDPRQLKRQARVESQFNPTAVSPAGAKGLFQFTDRTWAEWSDGTAGIQPPAGWLHLEDPFNPELSIRAGAAYMQALEQRFGNLRFALAAYNWGPGHVRALVGSATEDWIHQVPVETMTYLIRCLGYEQERLVVVTS